LKVDDRNKENKMKKDSKAVNYEDIYVSKPLSEVMNFRDAAAPIGICK
jgi:hypothetical protein